MITGSYVDIRFPLDIDENDPKKIVDADGSHLATTPNMLIAEALVSLSNVGTKEHGSGRLIADIQEGP